MNPSKVDQATDIPEKNDPILEKNQSMKRNTFALMGLAALAIANSHLEQLYPLSFLAADGLLGNLTFFMLAGYGVMASQSQRPDPLPSFYLRRIRRIYPTLWLGVVLAEWVGISGLNWNSAWEAAGNLIWPTPYRFVSQIMIFYPVVWALGRIPARAGQAALVAGLIWLGSWCWFLGQPPHPNPALGKLPTSYWAAFFLTGTLTGAWLATKNWRMVWGWYWTAVLVLVLVYGAVKCETALRNFTTPAAVPTLVLGGVLQILSLGMVGLLVAGVEKVNELLELFRIKKILDWVGKMSLQVYVLHGLFIGSLAGLPVFWGLKIGLFFILTLLTSLAVFWLDQRLPELGAREPKNS